MCRTIAKLDFAHFQKKSGCNGVTGGTIVEVIQNAGVELIVVGMLVTSIPVFVGYFVGRKILKLNPAEVLGGVTEAVTSGAALSVVTNATKSDAPSLGYTGGYAFANVILTLAGAIIMLI